MPLTPTPITVDQSPGAVNATSKQFSIFRAVRRQMDNSDAIHDFFGMEDDNDENPSAARLGGEHSMRLSRDDKVIVCVEYLVYGCCPASILRG